MIEILRSLNKLIEHKADKFIVSELSEAKANKIDTENNMKAIDIIHKQIRHLVIMLMENFRVQVDTDVATKQTKLNRMNTVLQQSLLLAKWIIKFNPENINSYDLTLPEDLKKFHDYVAKSMDEISYINIPSYKNKKELSKRINRIASNENCKTPAARSTFKLQANFKKEKVAEIFKAKINSNNSLNLTTDSFKFDRMFRSVEKDNRKYLKNIKKIQTIIPGTYRKKSHEGLIPYSTMRYKGNAVLDETSKVINSANVTWENFYIKE